MALNLQPNLTGYLSLAGIVVLLGATLLQIRHHRARSRDERRALDSLALQDALQQYFRDHQRYPPSGGSTAMGEDWSTTADGSWQTLIAALQTYMVGQPLPADPAASTARSVLKYPNAFNYGYYAANGRDGFPDGSRYMIVYRRETGRGERLVWFRSAPQTAGQSIEPAKVQHGYALPMVIMVSVALLSLGLTILQNSMATRSALLNQYYTRLAREAGESGVAYARYCLTASDGSADWTTAKPLMPMTDCTGTPRCGASPLSACSPQQMVVLVNGPIVSTFTVQPPDAEGRIVSVGTSEAINPANSVPYRSYSHTTVGVVTGTSVIEVPVTTNGGQTFVLASDGNVYGSGVNVTTYSANPTYGSAPIPSAPVKVALPAGVTAKSVVTGTSSVVYQSGANTGTIPYNNVEILGSDGQVYGAGLDVDNQLGDGPIPSNCRAYNDYANDYLHDAAQPCVTGSPAVLGMAVPISAPKKFQLPGIVTADLSGSGSNYTTGPVF